MVVVRWAGPCGRSWWRRIPRLAPFSATRSHDGDTLVVAAPTHRHTGNPNVFAGAYVFRQIAGTWQFEQELLPSDLASFQGSGFYGYSVAVNEGTIAVGAAGTVQFDEGVYLFVRNLPGLWVEQAKLQVANEDIAVGKSVALSGNRLVTTAGLMTHSFVRSGSTWTYEGPLGWGGQVALDGDLAMVSYTRMAIPAVTFYRWQGNAWSVEQVIETPVGARPPTGRLDTPIAFLGDRMAFRRPRLTRRRRTSSLLRSGRRILDSPPDDCRLGTATGWIRDVRCAGGAFARQFRGRSI